MSTGAITDNIDVAQLTLYAFWLFFAGLVLYLRKEDKREGYPLEHEDGSPHTLVEGFPGRPDAKTFLLPHGGTKSAPEEWKPTNLADIPGRSHAGHPGSPLEPTGSTPMLDCIGPGSWANRADEADLTLEGLTKIVPLRVDSSYGIDARDPDPRGHSVFGADGAVGGTVRDVWVDRSERLFRYYEVEVAGGRRVLLPVNFSKVNGNGTIKVSSILAKHFADVPGTRNPDSVTLLEEEKISAYYGAGTLYATPSRSEPLL